MSDVVIFHNPACGTSRNTLALLREKGVEPKVVEYLKAGWTREQLKDLLAKMDARAHDILRDPPTGPVTLVVVDGTATLAGARVESSVADCIGGGFGLLPVTLEDMVPAVQHFAVGRDAASFDLADVVEERAVAHLEPRHALRHDLLGVLPDVLAASISTTGRSATPFSAKNRRVRFTYLVATRRREPCCTAPA